VLKHKRLVSIIAAIAFCLAFVAPALIAPAPALAAVTYSALSVPTLVANSTTPQELGIIQVSLTNCAAVKSGDVLSVSLPSEVILSDFAETDTVNRGASADAIRQGVLDAIAAIKTSDPTNNNATAQFTAIQGIVDGQTDQKVRDALASIRDAAQAESERPGATGVTVQNAALAAATKLETAFQLANANTGVQVYVPETNPDGTENGLKTAVTPGAANNGSAKVSATRTSIDITFTGDGASQAGTILIYLNKAVIGSVEGDVTARLLAPANSAFPMGQVVVGKATTTSGATVTTIASVKTFGNTGGVIDIVTLMETAPATLKANEVIKLKLPAGFSWGNGSGSAAWGWAGATVTVEKDKDDDRILNVTITGTKFPSVVGGLSGRVSFAAPIIVDDSVAKTGDITVRVYSKNGAVTEQDLVVAKYATYGVTIAEGTKPELLAGKYEQKIGEFTISEDVAGSLIHGRSIKLTLPKGVKWSGAYSPGGNQQLPAPPTAESGSVTLGAYRITDNYTTLQTTVTSGTKSKFKFKDLKVDIAPDFTGPLTLTIGGDAGAAGEVVVAEVKPAVEITSEDITDVIIGEQDQKLGTIILKETVREAIALYSPEIETWESNNKIDKKEGVITLTLPAGAEWSAGYPTVEVTEGDLELKINQMSKSGQVLTIPVKSESSKPSTIKISGLKATLHRTVPEGRFEVAVSGTAINETGGPGYAFPQYEDNTAVVANCVTPAGDYGRSATFYIGSTIYSVNGVNKIMDVAPYIKAGRTYVPVRYLGEALGADVAWDEVTKTVTLTKGDKSVVLEIGSTIAKVNGADVQMDVAPEIVNGRTMLPARWVAQGLGYMVGWNEVLKQVVVQEQL